ncbi:MAG: SDR family oxidoreductase [Flavobacteriales bacterium]|nr:SDR family oxidoreductase [Flavobacteriales bacterium]
MKKIIITGISRGIGLELTKLLAAKGHSVLALSRSINTELSALSNVQCKSVDLTLEEDLDKVKSFIDEHWKNVDIVINNAGTLLNKPFEQITTQEFEYVYRVNVFGVASLIRIAVPYMHKGGHVVTISSMGGIQGSLKFPGLAAYSSSKGAVITLSELLAEEYKEKGISFNALALGAVQTEMLEEAFPGYQADIQPQQMAQYIADFSLTANQYINGKVIEVSTSTP